MKRETYIEDYEDFEPEMRTWPFLLLSFLIPLIPLVLNILLGSGFTPFLVLDYVTALLPLFCTALSIKDGERAWTLIVSSALYWAAVLVEWALTKLGGKTGYPMGIPFILALTPGLLPLAAYTFFAKRRRSNWAGWAFVSFVFSLLSLFFTWRETEEIVWIIYPSLMVLLSLMLFFVTRRTESTPWYITLPLVLLVLSSFTLYPPFKETLLGGTLNEKINTSLRCFLYSFPFWYTLSFLFVFSGLAGKSSYRKALVDDDTPSGTGSAGNYDDMAETVVVPSREQSGPSGSLYTNPPRYSRFDSSQHFRDNEDGEKEEEEEIKTERQSAPRDDKWYDFIEGGVKSEERSSSVERRRTDYNERDRFSRDERRERYDDRRDERYDDRYYRDERRRYCDDRDRDRDRDRCYRDERRRYYDDRDRDRDRDYDERDYYPRRYDDDYPPYDDRPRRS